MTNERDLHLFTFKPEDDPVVADSQTKEACEFLHGRDIRAVQRLVFQALHGGGDPSPLLWVETFQIPLRSLQIVVPDVVAQPLPADFAIPAAYGDLLTGALVLVALVALRSGWPGGVIPTFLVPLLLVTHTMIFVRPLRRESRAS